MASVVSRIREWYRAPEQELLRWEVARFWRWAATPTAAGYFGLALFLTGIHVADEYVGLKIYIASRNGQDVAFGGWAAMVFEQAVTMAMFGLPVVAAFGLAWRRSLAPFRQGRLAHLALARLEPREIWPALLAAPILAAYLANLIAYLGNVVSWLINPELPYESLPYGGTPLAAGLSASIHAASLVITPLVGWINHAALTAVACAVALPRATFKSFLLGVFAALLVGGQLFVMCFWIAFLLGAGTNTSNMLVSLASLYNAYPMLLVLAGAGFLGARRLWRAERHTPRAAMLLLALCIFAGLLAPIWEWLYGSAAAREATAASRNYPVFTALTLLYNSVVLPFFRIVFDLAVFALAIGRLRSPEMWARLREEAARE